MVETETIRKIMMRRYATRKSDEDFKKYLVRTNRLFGTCFAFSDFGPEAGGPIAALMQVGFSYEEAEEIVAEQGDKHASK